MGIPVPDLDDRDFADLVGEALDLIRRLDPEWTDLSVHDPGVVLVEAFAHLTDILLYRLNRVPDRVYATFLNLLGTTVGPPAAARVELEFSRPAAGTELRIPRGTRVTCQPTVPGADVPTFATTADAVLGAADTTVAVVAHDVVLHDSVVVGVGNGGPGQQFTLPEAPVVAGPDVFVGIQVPAGEFLSSGEAVLAGGHPFRTCREVVVFADARPGEAVFRLDRSAGVLSFPWFDPEDEEPPLVPGVGMQVRAWYRTGGGARGNVAAGRLTLLRDPVGGLQVTNPAPATGGRDAEPLAAALRRGPQDFQARDRAVTARDYEVLAIRHGGVERASARTRRESWAFAEPGEVDVVLVPHVPADQRPDGLVTREMLAANSDDRVLDDVTGYLAERATIGAVPVVEWARYKQVAVEATVVVRPDEDPDAVRDRIMARLAGLVTPLPPSGVDSAGGFGVPLRVSNLYRALEHEEPGVRYVQQVRLVLDEVPDAEASDLVRAEGQPDTWFVARGSTVFRTTNAGTGWEACVHLDGESVRCLVPWPVTALRRRVPGHVAVATEAGTGSRIHVSTDLGGTWHRVAELGFGVADLAWVDRDGEPALLAAGENGLYEISLGAGAVPVQNIVDATDPDRGFQAIVSFVDVRGRTGVALAAEAAGGIWLSQEGGVPSSFRPVRPAGEEVRSLTVSQSGPRVFLWVARTAPGGGEGTGCTRLAVDELGRVDAATLAGRWEELSAGWTGGSCWQVRVIGDHAYAASQSSGVLRLPLGSPQASWEAPDVNCGLPLRDRQRFQPVSAISGEAAADGSAVLLAAGAGGVHRSTDRGLAWRSCAERRVDDVVTIPPSWLFCSGEHRVQVVRADG